MTEFAMLKSNVKAVATLSVNMQQQELQSARTL